MKTIGAILLVLVAIIGMAGPVLGAEAGSGAGAYADWDIAQQYSYAWAQDDEYTPDAYADAGTQGEAEGYTESGSSAAAGDDWAGAGTGGYSEVEGWWNWGGYAATSSDVNAESWNTDGVTETGAGSYATGDYVEVDSGSSAYWGDPYWGDPIYSNSWADGYVYDYDGYNGYAESGGWSYAEVP